MPAETIPYGQDAINLIGQIPDVLAGFENRQAQFNQDLAAQQAATQTAQMEAVKRQQQTTLLIILAFGIIFLYVYLTRK